MADTPSEGTPQKLFLTDEEILDRLERTTPTALARELGVSRALILKRRERALRVLDAEALLDRRRKLERRRAKRKGRIAPASRAPENGPPPAKAIPQAPVAPEEPPFRTGTPGMNPGRTSFGGRPSGSRRSFGGRVLPSFTVDENFVPDACVGYAAWLDERDAAKPTREDLAADLREERARRMRLRQLGIPLDYAPWEPEFGSPAPQNVPAAVGHALTRPSPPEQHRPCALGRTRACRR